MHHTDFRQLEREEDQNLTRNEYEQGTFYGDDHEGVSRLIHLKLISNGHLMILLWAKQHLAHRLI